jgi:hypothetical protein
MLSLLPHKDVQVNYCCCGTLIVNYCCCGTLTVNFTSLIAVPAVGHDPEPANPSLLSVSKIRVSEKLTQYFNVAPNSVTKIPECRMLLLG